MPKITKIYTRAGDGGETSLGGGQRVAKDSLRIEAFGTVDELNSVLGAARAAGLDDRLEPILASTQNELFHLGSDLCILEADKEKFAVPRIEERHVDRLETVLDELTEAVGPLENFILPGGTAGSAHLHVARTVCRRAERRVLSLSHEEPVGSFVIKYLNRLSDTLFVMARYENQAKGRGDVLWDSHA